MVFGATYYSGYGIYSVMIENVGRKFWKVLVEQVKYWYGVR